MSGIPTYGEMRTRAAKIADAELKAAVLAGLRVLQDKYGDEWVDRIDCETLDLTNSELCVLGQVCGDYDAALDVQFHASNSWAVKHGFYTYDHDFGWARLQEAWDAVLCDGGVNEHGYAYDSDGIDET